MIGSATRFAGGRVVGLRRGSLLHGLRRGGGHHAHADLREAHHVVRQRVGVLHPPRGPRTRGIGTETDRWEL